MGGAGKLERRSQRAADGRPGGVKRELMDRDAAQSMLAWPHSGLHVHDGVWVSAEDRPFATRLARYCARHPVALSRLTYRAETGTVTYRSDKASGPTAGAETVEPDPRHPAQGRLPRAAVGGGRGGAARAGLLRRIFEVDPLRCPRYGHAMRVVAFITEPPVIDRILTHLRRLLGVSRVRPRLRRLWILGSGVSGCTPVGSGPGSNRIPTPHAVPAIPSVPAAGFQ